MTELDYNRTSSKTFLWIEDREGKASYIFWNSLLEQLCSDVEVVSKKNNSELVKAVRNLDDTENRYVIVFVLMDIICFEYILLQFKNLIDWIYAPDDEFLKKRAGVVSAREKLIHSIESEAINYKEIKEIVEYDEHIGENNIEQLSAKLLFDLTRNTGFEVSKGKIGECWMKSCCEWIDRQEDDICGLDNSRLSIHDKMKSIYEETCLKEQFHTVGLEVAL